MTYAVGRSTPTSPRAAGPSAAFHRAVSAGGARGDGSPPEAAGVDGASKARAENITFAPKKSDAEAAL